MEAIINGGEINCSLGVLLPKARFSAGFGSTVPGTKIFKIWISGIAFAAFRHT